MARIRKGDMVEIIAGNDKGKRGRVLRVIPDQSRIVVQGVNMRWKHMRKSQQAPQGGRMRREMPVHLSNVMFFDEGASVRSRIGHKTVEGKKVRFLRRTGTEAGATPLAEKAKQKVARKKAAARTKTAETAEKES